jgi:hypothetical protein
MTKPAKTYDDDGVDVAMTLQDWLEVLDGDVDEAVDDLKNQSELDQLVRFLRSKADEIAGIELDSGDGIDEQIERDEETEE